MVAILEKKVMSPWFQEVGNCCVRPDTVRIFLQEKLLNAVGEVLWTILTGAWKTMVLRAVRTLEAQFKWDRGQSCSILAAFCPPLKLSGWISLAEKVSRQSNTESVTVIPIVFLVVCNEKEQEEQNLILYVQSEEKGTMRKLVLEPRLVMKAIELFKSCLIH